MKFLRLWAIEPTLIALTSVLLAAVAAAVVKSPVAEKGLTAQSNMVNVSTERQSSRGDHANLDFLDTNLLLDPRLKDLYQVSLEKKPLTKFIGISSYLEFLQA